MSRYSSSNDGDHKTFLLLIASIFRLKKRRMSTRSRQNLSRYLLDVREIFYQEVDSKIPVRGVNYGMQPKLFLVMDETAVFLEAKYNFMVYHASRNNFQYSFLEATPDI